MIFVPYPPSEVADGVWVGGRPSAATLEALKAAGVTHVLNVSTDPHDAEVRRNFKATWVPVVDDLEPKPASWFRRGVVVRAAGAVEPGRPAVRALPRGASPRSADDLRDPAGATRPFAGRGAANDHRPAPGGRVSQRYTWSPPKRSSRRSPSRRSRRRSARRVRLAAGRRQDDGVGVGVSYSDPGACW